MAVELDELNTELQQAIARADEQLVSALLARLRDAAQRLDRAQAPPRRASTAPSARDLAVDALAELGVPSETKIVSRYVGARYDVELPSTRFSSLRRDEKRAGLTALTRPGLVAPLDASRLTPVTGMLALTTWPLELRIVGPRSRRVYALRATRSMLDRLEWLSERDPEAADKVRNMVVGLLATVPGALPGGQWAEFDSGRAREALQAELTVLEADDEAARNAAAERARRQLNDEQQLFGAPKMGVVATGEG